MTLTIRPGRYSAAFCEGPKGRDQTPWCRDPEFLLEMIDARRARGFKVLYVVTAIVPERPATDHGESQ